MGKKRVGPEESLNVRKGGGKQKTIQGAGGRPCKKAEEKVGKPIFASEGLGCKVLNRILNVEAQGNAPTIKGRTNRGEATYEGEGVGVWDDPPKARPPLGGWLRGIKKMLVRTLGSSAHGTPQNPILRHWCQISRKKEKSVGRKTWHWPTANSLAGEVPGERPSLGQRSVALRM